MKHFLTLALLLSLSAANADEGMWLYNQPPRALLRQNHKFDATDAWLEHLQKSSVRFNSGGSGSFVSEEGLLISNHHVGADALQKLSTKEKNYLREGFYARNQRQELKCFDLELNVLESIEDVTPRVNAALPAKADVDTAFAARRKIIAEIEKESLAKTGLRSDVVTLWQGGAYHLYCYKRYTDVRLVFAPEQQIAFFGGDPDNFEFPRYDLDICLFRAYENGKPVKVKHFLRFSPEGVKDGELVFVSGHPGKTSRLLTVAELENIRDQALPFRLGSLKQREVLLSNWSTRSEENARRAKKVLFGIQNSRKAFDGRLAGLLDPELFSSKVRAEDKFKQSLHNSSNSREMGAINAYATIEEATKVLSAQYKRYVMLEEAQAFNCESFQIARALLRAGEEFPKANGDRLREFFDSSKTSLELALFSGKPIYTDLEIVALADSLTFFVAEFGANNALVRKVLAGKSPRERAAELINTTKVRDVKLRKELYEKGAQAVSAAKDPMIELARLVDADARALRTVYDDQNEAKQQAHAAIARSRNALRGTNGYPDATGTLRLSFGVVKGYEENGKQVPALTSIGGIFARSAEMNNESPFNLPGSWEKAKPRLNLQTPFNFVSTCDIIGGNSGSPVVNREGEFVGIIFDGNLQSLPWDYAFSDKQGRATSVSSAAIFESIKNIYGAEALARELMKAPSGK
ncbi:MAG: hypothetical protein JWM68_5670 [Verrucomicrobiales bacterium]|nr:hypothetical protein [Verrucomicrobiales bacterium]